MILSGRMLISYLWFVTEIEQKKFNSYESNFVSLLKLWIQSLSLPNLLEVSPRIFASESTQVSTKTKSDTKLGIEHLKIASFPTMTLSLRISISYRWDVTEEKRKRWFQFFNAVCYEGCNTEKLGYQRYWSQDYWLQSQSKPPQTQNQWQNLGLNIWK